MSESGEFRDWRGVLTHAPVSNDFKNFMRIDGSANNMRSLIFRWIDTKVSDIENLQLILQKIDRYDIYEDTLKCFEKDAEAYREKTSKQELDRTEKGAYIITGLDRQRVSLGLRLIVYDAFLMYSERDVNVAALVKETLENNFGMHICIKNDFLGGIPFEHDAAMTLIASRCRRVIIIVSKSFVNCPADTFISKYAQHIGIEQSCRKIIPCLIEECEIPSNLRILFHLKYYKHGRLFNFWEKLYEAVAFAPNENIEEDYDRIPHKSYATVNVPMIYAAQPLPMLMQGSDSSSQEKHTKSQESEPQSITAIMRNVASPPTESPMNSTVIHTNKTKKKGAFKSIKKLFTKGHKEKLKAEPLMNH